MMGKEFFGKLLSNRQDKPEPWDRVDPEDRLPAVELDEASDPQEETDVDRAAGGDGQTSTLPEIHPPATPDVETPFESVESRPHDDQPDERFDSRADATSAAPKYDDDFALQELPGDSSTYDDAPHDAFDDITLANPASADSDEEFEAADADHILDYEAAAGDRTEDASSPDLTNPTTAASARREPTTPTADLEEELSTDEPSASSTNGQPEFTSTYEDLDSDCNASPQAGSVSPTPPGGQEQETRSGLEAGQPPESGNAPEARRAPKTSPTPEARPAPDARPTPEARLAPEARSIPEARPAADPSPTPEARSAPAAAAIPGGRPAPDATPAPHAVPDRDVTAPPAAETTTKIAPERQTPPAPHEASAPAPRRQADSAAASQPSAPEAPRSEEADAAPQRQPQTQIRKESATRTRNRERKETDPPRARPKAPASIQGDPELRGIKDRVVIRLLEKQLVSPTHVKAAISERSKGSLKATLWRIVAYQKGVDREAIYREAALTYAFVERKMEENEIDLEFVRQVADVFPEKRRNRLIELRVVPVGYEFEQQTQMLRVVFLTHDPSLPAVRELMQELNLERYELQYAPESDVKDLLAKAFPRKNEYLERMSEDPLAYDLGMSYEDEKGDLIDEDALEAEINRSSLINLFEAALVESVLKGASDIHIYPNAKRQVEIHFRIDGRLVLWHLEDKVHPESLLAVIKDNTMNVDRFERDMAQDGFIQRKVDDTLIRYRVSILPIATASNNLHAESIVIRVLDDRKVITDLSKLGLLKGALERFDMAIRQPHGMVILTGPTGSGKSTTLVAALHQVVTPEVNVLTVEDPVEYIISGVRQIKLNHKLNLEQALRSILRHDPDVVMVGEMRDRATAELAVKLANTGHLTFSTLHTNDAPSAVSRLYKMGVEPFLIAYAINLVVAQRLLRSLCATCKVVDNNPDLVLLKRLGFTDQDIADYTLFKPSGDPTCKTCKGRGYSGRRAISEALYFSRDIRHMIVEADDKIDEDALRAAARSEGMLTLQDSAREVVKIGDTSIDEMMRITMTEE